MRILFFFMLSFLYMNSILAEFSNEVSFATGMISSSFSENPSSFESTSTLNEADQPAAGGVSQIALDATYSFWHQKQRSFYTRAIVPILPSGGGGYFFGAIGANYFIKSTSSMYTYKINNVEVYSVPELRYYWGIQLGVGYLIYTTETAEKSDIFFELELHGGLRYSFNRKYGLIAEVGIGRGTGVATTTMNMKITFGLNYYIN
jgi:hypothetical protein